MVRGFPEPVRYAVGEAQHWVCKHCNNRIDDFHHKLQNTEPNRQRFPMFLNSPMNCVGLCKSCHEKYPHVYRVSMVMAEVYEEWLNELIRGIIVKGEF